MTGLRFRQAMLLGLVAFALGACSSASRHNASVSTEGDDELGRVRSVIATEDESRARLVIYSHDQGLRVGCDPAGWHDLPIPVVGRAALLTPGTHEIRVNRGTDLLSSTVELKAGRLYVAVVSLHQDEIEILTTLDCSESTVDTEYAAVLSEPPAVDFGDVEATDAKPEIVRIVQPEYPRILRDWAVEGEVVAHVLVTRDGHAGQVCVSSSENPLLDQHVIAAAGQCEFEAGSIDGVPVDTWVSLPYRFSLD